MRVSCINLKLKRSAEFQASDSTDFDIFILEQAEKEREEEEKRLEEERLQREQEEYEKMKADFEVAEEGTDARSEEDEQNLVQNFIAYIKVRNEVQPCGSLKSFLG